MNGLKRALLVGAVTCLTGTTTAWACDVFGSIVCRNDTSIGVSGVVVNITPVGNSEPVWSDTSGSDGTFYTHVGSADAWYDVNLLSSPIYCNANGEPIYLAPIQVDDPVQCGEPPPPPPPPQCTVTMPSDITFPYCPSKPLGNPKAECKLFGLAVLEKDELSGGSRTIYASTTAPIALVKAGGCYDVFQNVIADQTLLTAPFSQGISHVTYCACP